MAVKFTEQELCISYKLIDILASEFPEVPLANYNVPPAHFAESTSSDAFDLSVHSQEQHSILRGKFTKLSDKIGNTHL